MRNTILQRTRPSSRILAGCLLAACAVSAQPAAAQVMLAEAPAPSGFAEAIAKGRATVHALMDEHAIPGMSVAVLVDGEIVWSEGFGFANLEHRVPVTPLTRMRIGSVSKPVTAAALARQVERGRVDLDVPVQRYVPAFPEKRWPITTRQIAGHTAGIRHYRGNEFLSRDRFATVTEGLAIFQDDSLLFRPGTDYHYSSYGWNLVSAVIEGATGADFLAVVRREVFEPLGLRSIVAEHTDSIIPYRASFYERDPETGRVLNAEYVDNSYKWAGGGFLSTPEDLMLFGFGYIREPLLEPDTVELLFTPQRLDSGDTTGYGIGWRTKEDPSGRRTVGHTGGSVGGTTAFWTWPEEQMVIAVVSNLSDAPGMTDVVFALGELFIPPEGR